MTINDAVATSSVLLTDTQLPPACTLHVNEPASTACNDDPATTVCNDEPAVPTSSPSPCDRSEIALSSTPSTCLLREAPYETIVFSDKLDTKRATRVRTQDLYHHTPRPHALLCSQQRQLAALLGRGCCALLGNCPWLHGQLPEQGDTGQLLQRQLAALLGRGCCALLGSCPWLHGQLPEQGDTGQLLQIHHAFLVMQSTFLKHLAAAHYVIPPHARATYRNHNERVYWIHNTLLPVIIDEFRENFEALDRMYRLVKNYGNKDVNVVKKPGVAINDSWMYSEVHCGVAKANLELKIALNKCSSLDMFLDSCALNKHDIDLEVLNKDIDALIEGITKSLNTTQSAQLKLKKLKSKFGIKNGLKAQNNNEEEATVSEDNEVILKIEDKEPESKDEVFYFVRTEDDEKVEPASDVTTGPGKKERETTKVVLNELKRKLVKREDLMRERERQALVNTMPEYKNHMPEFPRQITIEAANKKGCISKFIKKTHPKKLFRDYKIKSWTRSKRFNKKVLLQTLKISKINLENDVFNVTFEAKTGNRKRKIMISVTAKKDGVIVVNKWHNVQTAKKADFDSSGMSEGLSDVEAGTVNKVVHQAVNLANGDAKQTNEAINFKFSKKDLELTPSDTDSDFENFHNERVSLLKDVRRHRVARKKNFPAKRNSVSIDKADEDESLKPMEYSFGTGMAMASVLQINNKAKIPTMAAEELFIGDGQVSEDSGNDEDA
ncbi:unnamed protein product [Plutella xylostella]|uniref:(diamondback moth) hypothetical protein n=1 Tax=Plutella xylostella TaxID=51655 RepID=A0A8S4G3R0_PLUXY|nr:unnamed protein product [Plutella xylostella]